MKILKFFGQLDQSDLSFVTDSDDALKLEKVDSSPNKINFKEIFPETHDDLIAILQSMLEFNPFFRKKPEEYLQMEIFEPWRTEYPELLVPPPRPIKLEINEKNAFDYEKS